MQLKKQTKSYQFEIGTWSLERNFSIEFEKNEMDRNWSFVQCQFNVGRREHYSLKDWEFLAEVNQKIHEILEELNK